MDLVDLEGSQSLVDTSLMLVKFDLLEGQVVGLGLREHFGLNHLLRKCLLSDDLRFLEVSELTVDFLGFLESLLSLLLHVNPLFLILPDKVVEVVSDFALLANQQLLGLSQVGVGLLQIDSLALKSVNLTLLLLDVVLQVADGRLSGSRVVDMHAFKHLFDSIHLLPFQSKLIDVVQRMAVVSIRMLKRRKLRAQGIFHSVERVL